MRLLPKSYGARPIVNLSRKSIVRPKYTYSVNQFLKNSFHILIYEKVFISLIQQNNKELFESAAFGRNDIYSKLSSFKRNLSLAKGERLYFCKVDIKSCFDSINQELLMEILESFLTEVSFNLNKMEYIIKKYCTVQYIHGDIKRRYNRRANSSSNYCT
jgi:telomerase reverse transcriptase